MGGKREGKVGLKGAEERRKDWRWRGCEGGKGGGAVVTLFLNILRRPAGNVSSWPSILTGYLLGRYPVKER